MYGSFEQAFVGRDEPKNSCEGGYIHDRGSTKLDQLNYIQKSHMKIAGSFLHSLGFL